MHLSSVILHSLPLHDQVAVVLNHFIFGIISLTVDCGIFSSEKISQLDLFHYHGNILEFTELLRATHFFYKCLWKQSACLAASFYTPVVMEVIATPEFNDLDGCVLTFANIV